VREAYARGYAQLGDAECSVGIEIREGDPVEEMTVEARLYAARGLSWAAGNHDAVVRYIECTLAEAYPGRAYFVETEEAGRGVQVYDPRDFVKTRCDCPCTEARE
jgi:hypothetical protein